MSEDGIPDMLKTLPGHISDVVKPWAERSPDHPALVETAGTWTYRQLVSVIADTQVWLQGLGVRPGDRVMIVCDNCRAFVAILLGAASLDAWPVLVNARLSAREIDEIRDHCGARRVFYTTSVSPHATAHAKRHGAVIADVAGLGTIGIGALNENVEPEPVESNSADQVAALIYTSGTTGLPKGVMLTHRNLLFMAAGSAKIRSLAPDDRFYGVLPMSHAVGLSVVLLGSLFGLPLHNGYGVTECAPTIAQTRVEAPRSDTSIGPVFPGVEVKLVGPDGKRVAEAEVGELCVRGPNVMKGYYRAPEETAAAID